MVKPLILIVDDNSQNIKFLGNLLIENDYEPAITINGIQALDFVKRERPDLILLDVMMPGMDGFQVCRKLKEDKTTRHIPVIFLTAKAETDDVVTGFQVGGIDYVTKPFNTVELLTRLKTQLELEKSRRQIIKQSNERKELLHILCHDLLSPLSSIKGFFELILSDASNIKKMEKHISLAIDNGLGIIDWIKQMLALDEGKLKLTLESCNLADLLYEACSILHLRTEEKNIAINLSVDNRLFVLVDKISFVNSVMMNILSNAIKFSYPGSIIDVKAFQKDNIINVAVTDSGIGMSEELKSNIFDINVSHSKIGTIGEQGTGFGMPIVKKLITACDATIKILSKEHSDSSTDHGTTIILELRAA